MEEAAAELEEAAMARDDLAAEVAALALTLTLALTLALAWRVMPSLPR